MSTAISLYTLYIHIRNTVCQYRLKIATLNMLCCLVNLNIKWLRGRGREGEGEGEGELIYSSFCVVLLCGTRLESNTVVMCSYSYHTSLYMYASMTSFEKKERERERDKWMDG